MTQQHTAHAAGDTLPAVSRTITPEQIGRYADASGDHNPLHIDPAFAATTRFGGPIAHGMLVLALVSEMLTAAFGRAWLDSGRLKVRFRGAARPGDTVTASGVVTRAGAGRLSCDVECRNQADEVLISGDAEVTIE